MTTLDNINENILNSESFALIIISVSSLLVIFSGIISLLKY